MLSQSPPSPGASLFHPAAYRRRLPQQPGSRAIKVSNQQLHPSKQSLPRAAATAPDSTRRRSPRRCSPVPSPCLHRTPTCMRGWGVGEGGCCPPRLRRPARAAQASTLGSRDSARGRRFTLSVCSPCWLPLRARFTRAGQPGATTDRWARHDRLHYAVLNGRSPERRCARGAPAADCLPRRGGCYLGIASACVTRPADVDVVTIRWICRRALRSRALVKLTGRICPDANRMLREASTVERLRPCVRCVRRSTRVTVHVELAARGQPTLTVR